MQFRHALAAATLFVATLLVTLPCEAQQQQLGHKILGGLGLKAGAQPEAGIYVGDRALLFRSTELVDRNGRSLPVGLNLSAFGNGLGIFAAIKLPWYSTYLNLAVSIPLSSQHVSTQLPEASIDRFGLGDLYVQPLKLGWRLPHVDVVTGYAFYAPTGQYNPLSSGGVGRGNWTHELSLGSAVFFDHARTWSLSALASLEINTKKRGIDITRGSTFQIQGGAGKTLFRFLDVGVAAYAEWQVSDDTGSALPPVLNGLRERAFGLGPEVGVLIPKIRTLLTLRYMHDIAVRSRPSGQIFVIGLTVLAWPFQHDD